MYDANKLIIYKYFSILQNMKKKKIGNDVVKQELKELIKKTEEMERRIEEILKEHQDE